MLISNFQLYPNSVISVKIIGVLITIDESGEDEKIIAVPSNCVDKNYENINTISNIQENVIEKIKHFFTHYKDNSKSKWVKIGELYGVGRAIEIYENSKSRYNLMSRV